MIQFEIQNFTKTRLDENLIRKIIHTTLRSEGIGGTISLGVVFVGRARMKGLNRKYGGENKVTDVLAFTSGKDFVLPPGSQKYLGEIAVCIKEVRKTAARMKKSFLKEFAHVLIHGTLHLLGYTHEGSAEAAYRMHGKEEQIISEVLYKWQAKSLSA